MRRSVQQWQPCRTCSAEGRIDRYSRDRYPTKELALRGFVQQRQTDIPQKNKPCEDSFSRGSKKSHRGAGPARIRSAEAASKKSRQNKFGGRSTESVLADREGGKPHFLSTTCVVGDRHTNKCPHGQQHQQWGEQTRVAPAEANRAARRCSSKRPGCRYQRQLHLRLQHEGTRGARAPRVKYTRSVVLSSE